MVDDQHQKLVDMINDVGEKHWAGIITYRLNNIRLISVRRAGNDEVELYES